MCLIGSAHGWERKEGRKKIEGKWKWNRGWMALESWNRTSASSASLVHETGQIDRNLPRVQRLFSPNWQRKIERKVGEEKKS